MYATRTLPGYFLIPFPQIYFIPQPESADTAFARTNPRKKILRSPLFRGDRLFPGNTGKGDVTPRIASRAAPVPPPPWRAHWRCAASATGCLLSVIYRALSNGQPLPDVGINYPGEYSRRRAVNLARLGGGGSRRPPRRPPRGLA